MFAPGLPTNGRARCPHRAATRKKNKMKKLMIAAAIVCAAAMSQAAAFSWSSSTTSTQGVIYGGDGTTTKAYATYGAVALYMFDAATYSQASALADFADPKKSVDTSKAVANTTLSSASKITTKAFDYGSQGSTYDFYFVALLDNSHIYVSSLMEDKLNPTSGTTALKYSDLGTTSKPAALDATKGFSGAAVYETVPEPTSGLLLLLGMAGLALRRRRA